MTNHHKPHRRIRPQRRYLHFISIHICLCLYGPLKKALSLLIIYYSGLKGLKLIILLNFNSLLPQLVSGPERKSEHTENTSSTISKARRAEKATAPKCLLKRTSLQSTQTPHQDLRPMAWEQVSLPRRISAPARTW